MTETRTVTVITVTPANEATTLTVPRDATVDDIIAAASQQEAGGLCYACAGKYDLGDSDTYLITDDETGEVLYSQASDRPDSDVTDAAWTVIDGDVTDDGQWHIIRGSDLVETMRGDTDAWEVLGRAEQLAARELVWRRTDEPGYESVDLTGPQG